MNIGISTFHFAPNSGAMLQCYALQKKIESLGHTAIVLDYRPKYHTNKYVAFRDPFIDGYRLTSIAKNVYYNRNFLKRLNRNNKYELFENYYNLSPLFNSVTQFSELNIDLDIIICGSDQIWNKNITNHEFDKAYFAAFPGYNGKKISYAASIGDTSIRDNEKELTSLLTSFKAISMREEISSEQLERILGRKVSTVPDPTMLLEKKDYMELISDVIVPPKYILVYFFGHNKLLEQVISTYKNYHNIPVINISPYKNGISKKYKWVNCLGPEEFLSYIYNAEIVITNSFHCSVFSTMFQKKLIVIKNENRNERIINLFNTLNVSNILLEKEDDIIAAVQREFNYDNIDNHLMLQKRIGESFLIENLRANHI